MASVDPLKPGFAVKDIQHLRNMVPIHTLPENVFADLLQDLHIDALAKNATLFKQGDTEQLSYYLLEGKLSLLEDGDVVDTLSAGEPNARFPIAHVLPRKYSVRADSRVRVASLDSRRISELLARTHQESYEVDQLEEAEPDDWMSLLLQSPVLQQLPASNIQRVMMSITQEDVEQGQQIIRQGDPGDYFYMLIQGSAVVTQVDGNGGEPQELARLGAGNSFGEEALLSDSLRTASITMLTPGQVLRLAKDDFLELVQSPLARHIGFDEAVKKVEGGAVWVDLRSPEDYETDHFPGSVNLPIESLRYQMSSLAPERHYVLYSNSGGRAALAAYLLVDQGFDVWLLEGGLKRLREEQPEESLPDAGGGDAARFGAPESSELQRRVQEAEQRAQDLEQQLKQAEASAQDVEQQSQQDLQELKGAVDNARQRLELSEEEKQAALADARKAYDEMEVLTSNLEKLNSERTELADRMREIEGLDTKLQARLQKAERELIGERERAESAGESLDDIEQRLNEVMQERQLERDRYARETGELKEEVTCLQLELEQATGELEELQALAPGGTPSAQPDVAPVVDESEITSLRQALAEREEILVEREMELGSLEQELAQLRRQSAQAALQADAQPAVQAERDALRNELAAIKASLAEKDAGLATLGEQLDEVQAHNAELLEQLVAQQTAVSEPAVEQAQEEERAALARELTATAERLDALQTELEQAQSDLRKGAEARAELETELAQRQAEVEELRSVMEAHVEEIRAAQEIHLLHEEAERDRQELQARLEATQAELQDTQQGLSQAPDPAEVEAMRQALHDTQGSLEERQNDLVQAEKTRHELEDSLEDTHAQMDRLRLEAERLSEAACEAELREKKAVATCARLQEEARQMQQQAIELELADIREEGEPVGSRPLDVDALGGSVWASRALAVTIGGSATLLVMEALSFIAGRGELITFLMK